MITIERATATYQCLHICDAHALDGDRTSRCHDTRKLELGFGQLSHICDAHALDDRTSRCHDRRKLKLGFDQLSRVMQGSWN